MAIRTWSSWSQIATNSGHSASYIDPEISNASGAGPGEAEYKIRAKDVSGKISGYSSTVSIGYGTSPEKRISEYTNLSYALNQNYPNPFNPSTSISYSLEKDDFVSLKVYDMLGREVAELVNENQPEGNYTLCNFPPKADPPPAEMRQISPLEFISTR